MDVRFLTPLAAGIFAVSLLTGCSPQVAVSSEEPPQSEVVAEAPEETTPEYSFSDGVLSAKDVKIEITDYRIIPVGEIGNEYGQKPVLGIWYNMTNLTDSASGVAPLNFLLYFSAVQDNDPNSVNELNVGGLPDMAFLESQVAEIKPGGTLANAIAYELDDLETPVELVATDALNNELGTMTINLK